MVTYDEFRRKTAVVTGAASGCGKEIAISLLHQGAKVAFLDIDFVAAQDAILELDEAAQTRAVAFRVDVADSIGVKNTIERVLNHFKGIDYLVNNAGISEVDFIQDVKEDDWDLVNSVNAKGTFLMTQEVAKYWIEQYRKALNGGPDFSRGVIVNIVSESAFTHHTMGIAYNASKAAQRAITKTSARELIKYGIRVNAVNQSIV